MEPKKRGRKKSESINRSASSIKVYLLPDEKKLIEELAKQAGLSLSQYLARVGTGYKVKSVIDYERVREIAKANGDLGRLGGLLKLWLTDDRRLAFIEPKIIRDLVNKIESRSDEISDLMINLLESLNDK